MNELFLERMKQMLGDEYQAYVESLEKPAYRGFRINTLKNSDEEFFSRVSLVTRKSVFAQHGYYVEPVKGIGVTPYYLAGLIYMQEPSASSAVTVLDPKPGDIVLDLCAAPGSKSTQILEKLENKGLLVANEINSKRAKILLENVMRNGAQNCIVTNNDTKAIAKKFPAFFDKVLCDAPCSGEGMMRKEKEAESQWSLDLVHHCAMLQSEILENAYQCLKPGGILVYSTCTLNKEENEEQMISFLQKHPDMKVVDSGCDFGRRAFASCYDIEKGIRIFPQDGGEGHFVIRLKKDGIAEETTVKTAKSDTIPKEVQKFLDETLTEPFTYYHFYQNRLYGGCYPFIDIKGLHVLSQQVYIGEFVKKRFEPSYALFLNAPSKIRNVFEMNDEQTKAYLHGEQINVSLSKGWYAMNWHGHALGGAKSDSSALKNKFPKAYRLR